MSPIIWRNICLDVPLRDISHAITMQVSIFGRGRDYQLKIMTWKVGASIPQRGTTICCCSQYNSASRHAVLRYGQCVCALFFFPCSMPCPLKNKRLHPITYTKRTTTQRHCRCWRMQHTNLCSVEKSTIVCIRPAPYLCPWPWTFKISVFGIHTKYVREVIRYIYSTRLSVLSLRSDGTIVEVTQVALVTR